MDVSGTLFPHANISCGLLQESILGPLLFSGNDMSGAVSNKMLLYAVDSAIIVADRCVSNIEILKSSNVDFVRINVEIFKIYKHYLKMPISILCRRLDFLWNAGLSMVNYYPTRCILRRRDIGRGF